MWSLATAQDSRYSQGPARRVRGCSSVGRAPEWHSGGRRFDSAQLHFEDRPPRSATCVQHATISIACPAQVGAAQQALSCLAVLRHASNILDFAVEHCTVPPLAPVANELVDKRVDGTIRIIGSTAREPDRRRRIAAAVESVRSRRSI